MIPVIIQPAKGNLEILVEGGVWLKVYETILLPPTPSSLNELMQVQQSAWYRLL